MYDEVLYPWITCQVCGEQQQAHYTGETRDRMVERQLCFPCLFWQGYVETKDDPTHFVADGHHYVIMEEDGSPAFRGYGGSKWLIKFNDGREVVTTNLWHQGAVPILWREQLPDSAVLKGVPR
jgi:hypothetical protein